MRWGWAPKWLDFITTSGSLARNPVSHVTSNQAVKKIHAFSWRNHPSKNNTVTTNYIILAWNQNSNFISNHFQQPHDLIQHSWNKILVWNTVKLLAGMKKLSIHLDTVMNNFPLIWVASMFAVSFSQFYQLCCISARECFHPAHLSPCKAHCTIWLCDEQPHFLTIDNDRGHCPSWNARFPTQPTQELKIGKCIL